LSQLKLGIFLFGVIFLFPLSSVYGHGLGIETISSVDIQGKEISISVELPFSFDNLDEKQITITAIEDETRKNAKNVTFLIGLFHENEMIFRNYFFTSDGILQINVKPTQEEEVTIHGEQDSLLGAWYGTELKPLKITGPIRKVTFFAIFFVSSSIAVIVICFSSKLSKENGSSTEIEISFP